MFSTESSTVLPQDYTNPTYYFGAPLALSNHVTSTQSGYPPSQSAILGSVIIDRSVGKFYAFR